MMAAMMPFSLHLPEDHYLGRAAPLPAKSPGALYRQSSLGIEKLFASLLLASLMPALLPCARVRVRFEVGVRGCVCGCGGVCCVFRFSTTPKFGF
jgi:hypothetical protein